MQSTDSQPPDARRPAPRRRRWIALVLALVAAPFIVFALVATVITLVLATPTGSRLAIEWLVARTQGALAIEQVQGSAWTGLSAGRVRWVDSSLTVEAQDLVLRLDWSSVLRRQPVVDQLTVRRLGITKPASDAPARLPSSLRLPLDWQVRTLQLESVVWQQGNAPPITLEAVSLAAAYGAGRYRVDYAMLGSSWKTARLFRFAPPRDLRLSQPECRAWTLRCASASPGRRSPLSLLSRGRLSICSLR
jgi:autotransporter translocation and assembly factor TamB